MKIAHKIFYGVVFLTLFSVSASSAHSLSKLQHLKLMLTFGEQSQLSHDYKKAESYYATALAEAVPFGAQSSELQECEARLATILVLQGELKKAEPHYLKAKEIATELLKNGADEPESFVWLDDLSDAYQLTGATKESLMCYEHVVALRKAISPRHKNLATAESLYGQMLLFNKKIEAGDKLLKDAYALSCKVNGAETTNTGSLCLTLANAYNNAGMNKDADKFAAISQDISAKRMGPDSEVVANIARLRATLLTRLGRFKDAETQANLALDIHQKRHGQGHEECAYDHACLAKVYQAEHKLSNAEAESNKAVQMMQKLKPTVPAMKIQLLETAASIQHELHHEAASVSLMNQAKALKGK